jgi:serine O-acetyltransferase
LRLESPDCPQLEAEGILFQFLRQLPAIRELLRTDVDAAFNGDPSAASRNEVIVSYPFLEAVAIQRMAHVLYLENLPLLPRIMTEWAHSRTGTDIHPGAKIGEHFFIDHCTGTVIGETCDIGSRVKMYQGVSLIARSLAGGQQLRGTKRHPTIEDNVTIYSGTTIMGGDTVIGAGSTIGANVFLTHSVPARSLVFYEEKQLHILDKDKREAVMRELDWVI